MFIKHRNQTHTKTHTPNAKYLQIHSDYIPQHIHHLLSSHRKQTPNAYIHFHSSQTHTDSRPNVLYFILSQLGEPNITTTHPPKISSVVFLHTDEIWKKRLADLGQSHQKKLTHLTVHPSPLYSSLASQASQPPIHQRFPVFSFCTQTKLTVHVCVCAVLQGFMNDGTCMCVCAVLQGFMNDGTCMCVCSFARIHE